MTKHTLPFYGLLLLVWAGLLSGHAAQSRQADSLAAEQDTLSSRLAIEAGLYNRYIWRGVNFADAPSVQALFLYQLTDRLEIGTYGGFTLNGSKEGYGNTVEIFATYRHKGWSLTIDDYFFFESIDSLNEYFRYGRAHTTHFVELRAGYEAGRFAFTGGYVIHTRASDDSQGLYLEGSCQLSDQLKVVVGGMTGASMLNFQDRAGISHVGLYGSRELPLSPTFRPTLQVALIASPNYRHVANVPGVARNPLHFLIALLF